MTEYERQYSDGLSDKLKAARADCEAWKARAYMWMVLAVLCAASSLATAVCK